MLRLAIGQINCIVGDLEGNLKKINEYILMAKELKTDIIAFPELTITGYPPEDLLLKPKFIDDNLKSLEDLATSINGIIAVVGFVDRVDTDLYNASAIIYDKAIKGIYHKMLLPNYGVFDENRYFKPGDKPSVFNLKSGLILGINICEDIWYKKGPAKSQAEQGAELIININASPYHTGKSKERTDIVTEEAKANNLFIAYTNLVGGQDELVFDGHSMVVNNKGVVIAQAAGFQETLLVIDIDIPTVSLEEEKPVLPKRAITVLDPTEEIYYALLLGLKDYVNKNGFKKVVIGLSGGIDSSIVATLAVDALGKDNIIGIFMPSPYSSIESEEDAKRLAQNLGIKFMTIPINEIFDVFLRALDSHFVGFPRNITEENLQARIRGSLLMAISNKFGWLVLATGNKSELSTGYATLYGDMAGGFAILKDVPKTLVYKLAEYRNFRDMIIPQRILTKEPTAELKSNQKDTDTLPPYEILDPILKAYIEEEREFTQIMGFDMEVVRKVLTMVDRSEYKRRQSPPGIKITPKALGKDRRMPITNWYSR